MEKINFRDEKLAQLRVGAAEGAVLLSVGDKTLSLTPEMADEIAASLRKFAIEAREGGAVPGLTR